MKAEILVIEDDLDIQASFIEVLQSAGYKAVGAGNGQLALEHLRSASALPSLILLDLMMPVMDGWAFREQQLLDPRFKEIPVVIVSAGGNVEQKAKNLSAVGWLKKPLEIKGLLDAVESALGSGGRKP